MSSISITIPANQDARVQAAIGHRMGLAVPASAAQVKSFILQTLIDIVRTDESDQAYAASIAVASPITPT